MTRPDVSAWTDEELCRELAAWQHGGESARLPASRTFEASAEYDRRMGVPTEDESFTRLYNRLQERKERP
jgi:hypothetical protein